MRLSLTLAALAMVAPVLAPVPVLADRPDYRWNGDRNNGWDPAHSYHAGRGPERRLGRDDRIYRGHDGRYYCRRRDGTTGLIVGGAIGGVLGNQIGYGQSRAISTIIGAAAGAAIGSSIDRGNIRCR